MSTVENNQNYDSEEQFMDDEHPSSEDFTDNFVINKKIGEDLTQKPKARLTNRMIKFVDEWFENGSKALEAYMVAYETTNRKYATTEGSKLLKHPAVSQLIAERQLVISEQKLIEKPAIVKSLNEIIEKCQKSGDYQNALRAYDMLIKMGGFYATNKPMLNVNSTGSVTVDFGGFVPGKDEEEKEQQNIREENKVKSLQEPEEDINKDNIKHPLS